MFGLFDAVTELVTSAVKIVVAPVEIVAHIANAVVTPIAEAVTDLVDDVKNI